MFEKGVLAGGLPARLVPIGRLQDGARGNGIDADGGCESGQPRGAAEGAGHRETHWPGHGAPRLPPATLPDSSIDFPYLLSRRRKPRKIRMLGIGRVARPMPSIRIFRITQCRTLN